MPTAHEDRPVQELRDTISRMVREPNRYRSRFLDIVEAMQKQYRYISNEALQMITDMLPMHAIALGQRRAEAIARTTSIPSPLPCRAGSRAPEGSTCAAGFELTCGGDRGELLASLAFQ
jgi:hypothetical protein